jgi:hypothetical protein
MMMNKKQAKNNIATKIEIWDEPPFSIYIYKDHKFTKIQTLYQQI